MANKEYQLVYDQSTSGTKLLLVLDGKIIKRIDKKHRQIYPKDGWVEHDPTEIWQNVESLFTQILSESQLTTKDITSISITNQRETIVAWDKTTSQPLYNAIVWQDNRSSGICDKLISEGLETMVHQKTGLRLDTYFSGTKILWLFENVPKLKEKSLAGNLAIGTMDSWLIWQMSQGKVFATEPSNACRTLLYDIRQNQWDKELAEIFGASVSDLPEVRDSSSNFGDYKGIPIRGVMADSQAALFGQGAIKSGDVKVTLGTGSSVLMQLENRNDILDEQILTTIADAEENKVNYALEGIIRSCADSINWFNENIANFENIDQACNEVMQKEQPQDIIFIPALEGLAAPIWKNDATGTFTGLKRNSTREDFLYAILESIIFQVKLVIDRMEEISGTKVSAIRVDGGVTRNKFLMQKLANLLNKEIWLGDVEELSALGALSVGNKSFITEKRFFKIDPEDDTVLERFSNWKSSLTAEFQSK
ncbi:FGGY-family carbohydrate kinase [Lactococcus lactis]|uniref:ATP:glycerol 3-phosphotransferase n=1 Tax=Lactococcus lactis subsp. lactis A12 TaxID=1137134 RepID=S6FRR5_LACLL|nr:FGGY family carbohydrate kinase [Lactococcus lactis]CDG03772.1 Glycerol kinase [Lactococcus lactis subsp. lactis A12]SBW29575.1 Glycerol kinase [Lactococcus lactis subsp. lactis]